MRAPGERDANALGFLDLRDGLLRAPASAGDAAVVTYVLWRSQGFCEGCGDPEVAGVSGNVDPGGSHPLARAALCARCPGREGSAAEASFRLGRLERAIDRGRFRLVTAAVLLDPDGRTFLARRGPGSFLAGSWEFPGGKAQPGEGLVACLRRELVEELGIRVGTLEPLGMVDHADVEADLWIRLAGYLGESDAASIRPVEHDATAWVRPDELERYALAPADVPLARRVRDRARARGTPAGRGGSTIPEHR